MGCRKCAETLGKQALAVLKKYSLEMQLYFNIFLYGNDLSGQKDQGV